MSQSDGGDVATLPLWAAFFSLHLNKSVLLCCMDSGRDFAAPQRTAMSKALPRSDVNFQVFFQGVIRHFFCPPIERLFSQNSSYSSFFGQVFIILSLLERGVPTGYASLCKDFHIGYCVLPVIRTSGVCAGSSCEVVELSAVFAVHHPRFTSAQEVGEDRGMVNLQLGGKADSTVLLHLLEKSSESRTCFVHPAFG